MLYQARGMRSSSRTNFVRRVMTWAIAAPSIAPAATRAGRASLPRPTARAQRATRAADRAADRGQRQRQNDDDAAVGVAVALALAARSILVATALVLTGRSVDRAGARGLLGLDRRLGWWLRCGLRGRLRRRLGRRLRLRGGLRGRLRLGRRLGRRLGSRSRVGDRAGPDRRRCSRGSGCRRRGRGLGAWAAGR